MEDSSFFESQPTPNLTRRMAGAFVAAIRFVGHQLETAELNPLEGRLRSSVMPSKMIKVPDFPPKPDVSN